MAKVDLLIIGATDRASSPASHRAVRGRVPGDMAKALPFRKPHPAEAGIYVIIDGHLRVEALRTCGVKTTNCLIALDDESFTYNRHNIGIAAIQVHKMIVKALDRGVPAEDLAAALGMSEDMIRARFRMLDGICREATDIMAEKNCPTGIFPILRKMKPLRQIDAASRMVDFNN
ncbi:hypothetical protein LGM43_34400 [Burkholderia seminalis]|uniref:plasmid partitioning protein RepB C-terminal domain-containing protein n=1 Tax=Burkholderia seminalis TaxID=488731 RepID=UPI001CF569AC|nr:plasmid partitioning protein RepB C-terminal domain-containing protein [Burkholderia seminalis]MCA7955356.1 hypothetical protein [Burkholderia seminalis]